MQTTPMTTRPDVGPVPVHNQTPFLFDSIKQNNQLRRKIDSELHHASENNSNDDFKLAETATQTNGLANFEFAETAAQWGSLEKEISKILLEANF